MGNCVLGCCCGKLFAPREGEEDLYELLEVPRRASAEEIRRAYRRKSLRLHPDKVAQRGETVTAEHREAFQALQRAYETLRDPEKRQVYDRLGLLGLQLTSDPMGAQRELFQRFVSAPVSFRLRIVGWLFLVFAFICLFPFLAAANIDELADLSWLAIAVPVWFYSAFGLLYHGFMLFAFENPPPPGEDDDEDEQPVHLSFGFRLFEALKFLLKLLQVILLLTALDDRIDAPWGLLFLPLFALLALRIGEGLVAFHKVPSYSDEVQAADPTIVLQHAMEAEEKRAALYSAVDHAFFLLQSIVLSLRLDGAIGGSYWLVAVPLYTYVIVAGYLRVIRPRVEAKALFASSPDPNEDGLLEEDAKTVKELRAELLTRYVGPSCSSLCCQLLLLVLVLVRIEESDFSTYIIFVPLLIPLGCFFCCLCLTLVTASPDMLDEAQSNPFDNQSDTEGKFATNPAEAPPGEASAGDAETGQAASVVQVEQTQPESDGVNDGAKDALVAAPEDVDLDLD